MRRVADALLDPQLAHMMMGAAEESSDPASADLLAAKPVETVPSTMPSDSSSALLFSSTPPAIAIAASVSPALTARQQAALLYALAGEQGDSESLLHLGWMLYYGDQGTAD